MFSGVGQAAEENAGMRRFQDGEATAQERFQSSSNFKGQSKEIDSKAAGQCAMRPNVIYGSQIRGIFAGISRKFSEYRPWWNATV
eukprot:4543880-Karenia_brevis.AAC.1